MITLYICIACPTRALIEKSRRERCLFGLLAEGRKKEAFPQNRRENFATPGQVVFPHSAAFWVARENEMVE